MFMIREKPFAREYLKEEEWLKGIFKKSKSQGSLDRAQTSLNVFDMWCKYKVGSSSRYFMNLSLTANNI